MTKQEFIDAIAAKSGLTKADSSRALEAMMNGIIKGLKKDKKVTLTGFATFENVHKGASEARNPRTGATIKVPAHNVAKIKAGSKLKEALN